VGWIAVAQVRYRIKSTKCGEFISVGTEWNRTVAEISDLKIDYIFGVAVLQNEI
jgi:hypothetical protein